MAEVIIVEKEELVTKSPLAIEGFPDVGLVGAIASSYIAERLSLTQVAHIESRYFPPVMVLHQGIITEPVRIFGKEDLLIITSEVAIPPLAVYPLVEALAEWLQKKGVRLLISISGYPEQSRMEIETPSVFGIASTSQAAQLLKENGIDVMEEGFIAGIYALLMKEVNKRGVPSVALLAQSFLQYPDPGAAASVILALNKVLKLNIDVKPLVEKADEIRVRTRDLMKQAQGSMAGMRKMTEREIPLMYH